MCNGSLELTPWSIFYIVLTLVSLIISYKFIKRKETTIITSTLAIFFPVLAVFSILALLFSLGTFDLCMDSTTTTGFRNIKPQLSKAEMTPNGTFYVEFQNNLNEKIYVLKFKATDRYANGSCTLNINQDVGPRGNFKLAAEGCSNGQPGDVYDLQISIDYETSDGRTFTDTGTLRGPIV
jgi:hypothetical protein